MNPPNTSVHGTPAHSIHFLGWRKSICLGEEGKLAQHLSGQLQHRSSFSFGRSGEGWQHQSLTELQGNGLSDGRWPGWSSAGGVSAPACSSLRCHICLGASLLPLFLGPCDCQAVWGWCVIPPLPSFLGLKPPTPTPP